MLHIVVARNSAISTTDGNGDMMPFTVICDDSLEIKPMELFVYFYTSSKIKDNVICKSYDLNFSDPSKIKIIHIINPGRLAVVPLIL